MAIKKLKSQQMTKAQVDEFAKEAAVMVGLRHPNILLLAVLTKYNQIYISYISNTNI